MPPPMSAVLLALLLTQVPDAPDAGVTVPDAGVPAPFLANVNAKFGEGVTFQSGEVKLNLRGRIQTQFLSVFPTEESTTPAQTAFFVRRARLQFKGEFPFHLSLNLQLAFAKLDMEADEPNVLRDANVQWAPLRDLSFRLGQMKIPFDVQRVVSSSSLQFVDRSTATGELNLDRDVGLVVYSDDFLGLGDRLRYALYVFGGDGRNRIGTNTGLLYGGRIRFSVFGKFDDRVEGDPDRASNVRLAFGAAAARNFATNRPRSTIGTPYTFATFDYSHATGDVHFKWHGVSLLSSIYWRQADVDSVTRESDGAVEWARSGWGWFVQGGVYCTDWLELAARYADTRPLGATDPKFHRITELGGTVNLMFKKHDFKLQTDVFWLDEGGNKGRVQLRVQAQVYF